MSDDDFKIIKASTASGFEEVRLYNHTLQDIPNKHPEIKLAETQLGSILVAEAIEQAVVSPTQIYQSATSDTTKLFTCSDVSHQGNQIVVAVRRFGDTTSGQVRTAYFSNDMPGTLFWSAGNE
jgi:hypothetical protein